MPFFSRCCVVVAVLTCSLVSGTGAVVDVRRAAVVQKQSIFKIQILKDGACGDFELR